MDLRGIGKKQLSIKSDKKSNKRVEDKGPLFQSYISDFEKSGEGIEGLLQQIEAQGERLTQSLTLKDLRAYKQLVQQFMRETVAGGVSLKSTRTWHRPQSHAHSILQVVDQTLIQLTDEMLKKDVDRVNVLQYVGEIKGMLIDLYQ